MCVLFVCHHIAIIYNHYYVMSVTKKCSINRVFVGLVWDSGEL